MRPGRPARSPRREPCRRVERHSAVSSRRDPDRPDRTGLAVPIAPPAAAAAPHRVDAPEAFRDVGGLVLLESARPGRNARWTYLTADPVAVLEAPAAGPDPFAVARRLVARLDPSVPQ